MSDHSDLSVLRNTRSAKEHFKVVALRFEAELFGVEGLGAISIVSLVWDDETNDSSGPALGLVSLSVARQM